MGVKLEIPDINLKVEEIRIILAAKLFEDGIVSLGKASEVAGYSERTFAEILLQKGIPPIKYEGINVAEELSNA
ncbi:UPF0175 family protein [candidate division WOR-3 bacterium]|nr:UPF0175 family protein [candidate division WOR-3 bacterium]